MQDVPVRGLTEKQNYYPQCVWWLLTFC